MHTTSHSPPPIPVSGKGVKQYLLSWAPSDGVDWPDSWVCQRDVNPSLVDADSDWARAKAAARASTPAQPKKPKPSPPKAAAVKKAATTRRSGDVAISSSARALLDEIKGCANNVKEFQYEEKKRTTAGGLFMVSACGLFVGARSPAPYFAPSGVEAPL